MKTMYGGIACAGCGCIMSWGCHAKWCPFYEEAQEILAREKMLKKIDELIAAVKDLKK